MGNFRLIYTIRFMLVLIFVWSSCLSAKETVYLAFGEQVPEVSVNCKIKVDPKDVSVREVIAKTITDRRIPGSFLPGHTWTGTVENRAKEIAKEFARNLKRSNLVVSPDPDNQPITQPVDIEIQTPFDTISPTPTVTVYFQPLPAGPTPFCLEGLAYGDPDGKDSDAWTTRYNRKKVGAFAVLYLSSGDRIYVSWVARLIAHEVGHVFGLMHVGPYSPTSGESIMDDRPESAVACKNTACTPRYYDETTAVGGWKYGFNLFNKTTHNPQYHARRYAGDEDDIPLRTAGLCPGSWDVKKEDPSIYIPEFLLSNPPQTQALVQAISAHGTEPTLASTIYDLRVAIDTGLDSRRVVAFYEQVTLDQPLLIKFNARESSVYQIFASSTPGGPVDIWLSSQQIPGDDIEDFIVQSSDLTLYLIQEMEDGAFKTVASVAAKIVPERLFDDGFETGALGVSKKYSTSVLATQGATIQGEAISCTGEFLEVIKAGSGKGTVVGESALNEVPEVINCGPECPSQINTLAVGDVVKLTASPDPETKSNFTYWTGVEECEGSSDPVCYVPMTKSQQATAQFDLNYKLVYAYYNSSYIDPKIKDKVGPYENLTVQNKKSYLVGLELDGVPVNVHSYDGGRNFWTYSFPGIDYGTTDGYIENFQFEMRDLTNNRDVTIPIKLTISNEGYRNIVGRTFTLRDSRGYIVNDSTMSFEPFENDAQTGIAVYTTPDGTVTETTWGPSAGYAHVHYSCDDGEHDLDNLGHFQIGIYFGGAKYYHVTENHVYNQINWHLCPENAAYRIVYGDH